MKIRKRCSTKFEMLINWEYGGNKWYKHESTWGYLTKKMDFFLKFFMQHPLYLQNGVHYNNISSTGAFTVRNFYCSFSEMTDSLSRFLLCFSNAIKSVTIRMDEKKPHISTQCNRGRNKVPYFVANLLCQMQFWNYFWFSSVMASVS